MDCRVKPGNDEIKIPFSRRDARPGVFSGKKAGTQETSQRRFLSTSST